MMSLMKTDELVPGEIFHVFNRTVEGQSPFTIPDFAEYFLDSLLFANTKSSLERNWRRKKLKETPLDVNDKLVDYLALILIPNHFHLLVRQITEGGIQKVMHRSCDGLARYFNTKKNRQGHLFMGRYKAVHVSTDQQAMHLFTYIHGNALDLVFPEWRDGSLKNWRQSENFLKNYKLSSLPVFLGGSDAHTTIKQLINQEFALNYYGTPKEYLEAIHKWSSDDYAAVEDLIIE